MREDIIDLQRRSSVLEPSENARHQLLNAVKKYTDQFLNNIKYSPAFVPDDSTNEPITDFKETNDIEELLSLLQEGVDKFGINQASAKHLGFITGGGLFTAAIADFLADVTNRYSGLKYASPGAVLLENQLINWSKELIGYPEDALGNLTSGGSIANLIAIVTARDHHRINGHIINKSVIYLSQQTHHSIQKALRIAGLANCMIRYIETDSLFRLSPHILRDTINEDVKNNLVPFLIVASCGNTDTGAVDPLEIIGQIAVDFNLWYHIDAAYGGYFILCEELKEKFKGINLAHSVVMDPHKTLFLPYGSGLVLIREGQKLYNSFHYSANYLQDVNSSIDNTSPADLSPELTKPFRGLRMWLPLKLHGSHAFACALYEKHLLATYFYEKVQCLGFQVGPPPELSVCIYRYIPINEEANEFNARLVKHIIEDGRIFVSSTTISGTYWIRIAIVCFRTHLDTIDLYLQILEEKVTELNKS